MDYDDPPADGPSARDSRRAERLAAKLAARAERDKQRHEQRLSMRQTEHARTAEAHAYYLSGAHKKLDIRTLSPFGPVAEEVIGEERSEMGYDRLYTLWQAAATAPRPHPFIEVGSYQGGSARFIATVMEQTGNPARFFICDTFAGHPRADPILDPVHYATHKFEDTSEESVREYLRPHRQVEIIAGDIVETSVNFASERAFGFVHIDVDVHPATAFCLDFFSTRLAPGAWMVLDDYGFLTCPGAKKAADDFIATRPEFRLLHLLTGQAIVMHRDA